MFVKVVISTPYAGTKKTEYLEVDSENVMEVIFHEMVEEHISIYDYLVLGWGNEPQGEEDDAELAWYYEECYSHSYWEEISEEEFLETE